MGWQVDAVAREQDPDNHYLWRSHPQRLAAETMRDSLLWVGGTLDVERPQGSLVAQAGPFEIGRGQPLAQLMQMSALRNAAERMDEGGRMESMSETPLAERRANANPRRQRDLAGSNRVAINEATVNRAVTYRSVYLPIVRDLLPRSLELFDAAEPSMVIGVREQSNTAPQALYLMNNEWVQQQAGHLAQQTLNQTLSPSQAIEYVFKSTYSRPPSAVESAQGLAYLENVTHQFVAAAQERKPQENTERQRRQRRDGLARRRPRLEPGDNSQTQDLVDSSVGSAWAADTSDWSAAPQEIQRQALTVFCHAILATAEFRYRN